MSKKRKKSWLGALSLKTKVIAVVSVLGVIGAVALTIWLIQINQPVVEEESDPSTARAVAHEQQVRRSGVIRDNAAKALEEGGTERANQVYTDAIASEEDTTRKVQLAIDQSLFLYNQKQYKEAVKVAKAAENYSEDKFLIADWLSQLYESGREYKQAAKYYTLAGKWADSSTNKSRQTKAYYDNQAARVSALAERK